MSRADRYANLGADYHWRWWVSRAEYRRWMSRLLSELPNDGNGATMLNIACGDGVPAAQLVARGYVVHCVDYLEEPLLIAKNKVPGASFSNEVPEGNFDYVMLAEGLKDFEDDQAVIQAIKSSNEYSIVTGASNAYSEHTVGRLFSNCDVELILSEDDVQAYLVEPRR